MDRQDDLGPVTLETFHVWQIERGTQKLSADRPKSFAGARAARRAGRFRPKAVDDAIMRSRPTFPAYCCMRFLAVSARAETFQITLDNLVFTLADQRFRDP